MKTAQPGSYPGSKGKIMGRIHSALPAHSLFVSVFGGIGGDILSHPETAAEVWNDINRDNFNFFSLLQDRRQRDELIEGIVAHPATKEVFRSAKAIVASDEPNKMKRAIAWGVVANLKGAAHDPSLDRSSFDHTLRRWKGLKERLYKVSFRMRHVRLTNLDCCEVIRTFDGEDTLFVVDPPYLQCGFRMYKHQMSESQHEEMLWLLRTIKGKAIVFNYSNALYRVVLRGWDVTRFNRAHSCCSVKKGEKQTRQTDFMWSNFTFVPTL